MMNGYPIVVVGASAGGVEAITGLFRGLKPNLPAAILIVMHIPQAAKSYLPEILNRHGFLPAAHARDGEKIQPGHVYVAPPGRHLLVENGRARLAFAPLVNHTRPAIDPLFESAASSYRDRVLGVILSGTLSDGSMGLASIKRAGGITVVQSPEEALFDEMPSNALELVQVDYSLPVSEIALLINRISTQAAASEGVQSMSFQTFENSETNETSQIRADIEGFEKGLSANQRSVLTCPDCGGVLWEMQDGRMVRYRCHTGHVYSAETLLSSQNEDLERALWTALRVLVEKAALANRLMLRAKESENAEMESYYAAQARDAEEQAQHIRRALSTAKEMSRSAKSPGEEVNENITQTKG